MCCFDALLCTLGPQTSCNDLGASILGSCKDFEERQVGGERYNFFSGCDNAKTSTIILRGGAEQFIEEAERSLHDAIMNTRRLIKNPSVIAGGGAIEMELSAHLRDFSRNIFGKQQLLISAYAKALEVIPRQAPPPPPPLARIWPRPLASDRVPQCAGNIFSLYFFITTGGCQRRYGPDGHTQQAPHETRAWWPMVRR